MEFSSPGHEGIQDLKVLIAHGTIVLSDSQKHVVEAALLRPHLIAFGTVSSIAKACDVSPTTVVRAVTMLGFRNFRDFRAIFQQHLKEASRRACSRSVFKTQPVSVQEKYTS